MKDGNPGQTTSLHRKPGSKTAKIAQDGNQRTATPMKRIPNAVEVAQRAQRAIALASRGLSWEQIAHEAGYGNKGSAWRAVHRELRRKLSRAIEEYHAQELVRLDALYGAYYPRAIEGDTQALTAVMTIGARRARLLGIFDGTPDSTPDDPAPLVEE